MAVRFSDGRVVKVGRAEVTFALWKECYVEGSCDVLPKRRRKDASGNFPVTGVSRVDVDQFVVWVNRKTRLHYRLPTIGEWREMAGVKAGIGKTKRFDDPRLAWAADYGTGKTYSRKIEASGHFGVAKSGVADLGGNVWEWTATCAVADGDPDRCPAFIAAGDHEAGLPVFLRDPFGGGCATGTPATHVGFRLVREP